MLTAIVVVDLRLWGSGVSLNKSDIVEALAQDGHPRPGAAVDRMLEVIAKALRLGESVSIRNFGKFEPRFRSAVIRRNPKTGIAINVPEKHSVGFVPAPALKERINLGMVDR